MGVKAFEARLASCWDLDNSCYFSCLGFAERLGYFYLFIFIIGVSLLDSQLSAKTSEFHFLGFGSTLTRKYRSNSFPPPSCLPLLFIIS